MSYKTAVIVLNWNGKKDTLECLESVKKSKFRQIALSVYIVDNASTDDSVSAIKKNFPDYKLIVNAQNLGFAAGNNVGIKQALADGADYVILLNNDTTVKPDTFEQLVTGAVKNKFNLAAPKIYFYPGCEFHKNQYKPAERGKVIWYAGGRIDWANVIPSHIGVDEVDHGQWETPMETDFATGCCLLIDKSVVAQIGYLDQAYKMYFEDNDYSQRAKAQKLKVGYLPGAKMWHKNAGSTGGSGSKTQVDYVNQSRFKFAMRYAPWRAKLAIIRNQIAISYKKQATS